LVAGVSLARRSGVQALAHPAENFCLGREPARQFKRAIKLQQQGEFICPAGDPELQVDKVISKFQTGRFHAFTEHGRREAFRKTVRCALMKVTCSPVNSPARFDVAVGRNVFESPGTSRG
jgi:hypothetical protein